MVITMSNIYFTSDTHYGHANIASKNTSKWSGGYRHYSSVEEMNIALVTGINKTVKEDDILYHLGDWSFGGISNIWEFRRQIKCKNIHLILGNHDHHIESNKLLLNVHENVYNSEFRDGPNPKIYGDARDLMYDVEAQRLFSSVSFYKELKINGKILILSHYAHRVWHGSHKGWYHLYGHSHDTLPGIGRSMDVGVDSAIRKFGIARPFSFNEIQTELDRIKVEFVDHHTSETNA